VGGLGYRENVTSKVQGAHFQTFFGGGALFGSLVLRLSNCRTNPGLGITKRPESVVFQRVRCDTRLRGQVTWVLRCVAIVGIVYENSSKGKVWCRSQRVPSTALSLGVRLPTAQNVRGRNTRRRRASSQEVQGPFGRITTVIALIQASFSAPLPQTKFEGGSSAFCFGAGAI
jgi:hypothetical protein